MKKINGGYGKEIEVSEDVEDIDPESMLEESNLEPHKPNISNNDISDPQIFSTVYLASETDERKINGLFKKLSFLKEDIEYEFIILKTVFLTLINFQDYKLHKIVFRTEGQEYTLTTEVKALKAITFESFGKQIKCCLVA